MKILMLTDVLFPDTIGGAGRVAYHLCNELGTKGHSVHIITRNPGVKLDPYQSLPNLDIHRFKTPLKESACLFFHELKNSYQVAKTLFTTINFDIICVHQAMSSIGPLMSSRLNNIPLLYFFHSPWHEEYLTKKMRRRDNNKFGDKLIAFVMLFIEKRILHKASKVIVLSRYMEEKVSNLHSYPMDKISIIPGGVDLNHFVLPEGGKNSVKQNAGFSLDKSIFFCVRNLVPRMGLDNLMEAFNDSEALKKHSLLLIGGKGPLENHLKSLVSGYGLNDTVRFLGHIPDDELHQYYQAADFFILPTEKLEGFGLVILEAMACGTPVIGTPVGAIPEIIKAFDKRLLTKGVTSKDIKEKLEEVITDPESYNFKPEAYRKFVVDNFSWKKMADDFEKVAIGLISH